MLRHAETRTAREAIDGIVSPVFLIDALGDGRFRFFCVNRLMEIALGPRGTDAAGQPLEELLPEERAGRLERECERCIKDGVRVEFVDLAEHVPELVWRRTSLVPLFDDGGRVVRILGTTELMQHNRQNARVEAGDQLLRSREISALGQLAGGVAQDFSALMAIVLERSGEILQDLAPRDAQRDAVEEISRTAELASALAKRLQALARGDSPEPAIFDAGQRIVAFSKLLRRLIGSHVALVLSRGKESCQVLAIPELIDQILLNLVLNARDAMPKGGTVGISVRADAEAGEVKISVSDTGTGVPLQLRDRIFEPFFTTKGGARATGLGLSNSLAVAREFGGALRLENNDPTGSRFTLSLPLVNQE